MWELKYVQPRQVCYRKNIYVNFDVAYVMSGVDLKYASRDYSAMLPHVCSLFTCHFGTINSLQETRNAKHLLLDA